MQGVDGVFHVAGWYKIGTRDKSGGERINIQGTRNVLELMQELQIPRGVYTSPSSIQTSWNLFLKGQLPALPSRTAMCWAHVEDTAFGHILAMETPVSGQTYIIAGERCSLVDLFKIAGQITGKRAPIKVPYQIFRLLSILVKPFSSILPQTYTSEGLRIMAGVTYLGDNSKAKRELGYKPRPVREGLEQTLRYEMSLLGL